MEYQSTRQMDFFSEMSKRQVSVAEFFSNSLLDLLERNFGLKNVLISYFDTHGKFLSWIDKKGLYLNSDNHPYRKFITNDVIRHIIYQEAVNDKLTYFNVIPRLYKSTDIINEIDYNHSAYVRFLEENFQSSYSLTMAFGINAYIQVVFLKSAEKGDFTSEEIKLLKEIYTYIANFYKNFKKYEQSKIISDIQKKIISSGENAFLIIDDFKHIMSYNDIAQNYLKEILGITVIEQMNSNSPCSWLAILFEDEEDNREPNNVQTRIIKDYIFKIYTYNQSYSNGIIDKYYWVTIVPTMDRKKVSINFLREDTSLTQTEKKVASLIYNGLTYKEIASTLVVSYHTIKKHVQNIYTKCGVQSRFQFCKWIDTHL